MTISPRGEARKLRAGDSTTNKPKDEARINEALAAQGFLPLTYGEQLIPLSAAGKEAE